MVDEEPAPFEADLVKAARLRREAAAKVLSDLCRFDPLIPNPKP